MHQQIRSVPAKSPPSLEGFLGVLREAGVNLVAAGGGSLEVGGEFAFVPTHEHTEDALQALRKAGYQARLLEADAGHFRLCWLTNEPGQLHRCIAEAAADNLRTGQVIHDILIGVEPDGEGRIPVHIYSTTPEASGGVRRGDREAL